MNIIYFREIFAAILLYPTSNTPTLAHSVSMRIFLLDITRKLFNQIRHKNIFFVQTMNSRTDS